MRSTLLAALITSTCLLPNLAQAQASSRGGAAPTVPSAPRGSFGATMRHDAPRSPGRPAPNPARPVVPLAPPSAPPIGPFASPSALDRDVFRARPRTYAPRYSRSQGFYYGYSGGYVTDPFGYISQPDSSAPQLDRYMSERDDAQVICVSMSSPRARRCMWTVSMPERSPTSAAAAAGWLIPDRTASNSGPRDTTARASSCGFARTTSSRIAARSPDATTVRSCGPRPDHQRRST